jgi:thioredoxin-like negative regulator of GroEL
MNIVENGIMYFYHDTDNECKKMNPIIDELERDGISVDRVDITKDDITPRYFQVVSIPTISVIKENKEVFYNKGLVDKEKLKRYFL